MIKWLFGAVQRRDDRWERAIDALDPKVDAHAIVNLLANHVFPLDVLVATELGQLRTFSIPSITALLHATGRYEREGARRLDDTKAILVEIVGPGPHTPEGREMIAHLQEIHGHYKISNDDYLLTLSVFVIDPAQWIDDHGWRPLRPNEREALFNLYRSMGEEMGIRDLPPDFEGLQAWREAYEQRARAYSPENESVARGLLAAIAERVPRSLRGAVVPIVSAILRDDAVLAAIGLHRPSLGVRAAVGGALAARQRVLRHVTPWNDTSFWETSFFRSYPTYPDGYERMRLGPKKVIDRMEKARARKRAATV